MAHSSNGTSALAAPFSGPELPGWISMVVLFVAAVQLLVL